MKRSTLLRTGSIAAALLLTACTSTVYRYAELDEHAYFYVKNETGQPYFNTLVYADNTSCSKPQKLYLSKLDDNWRASPKNNRPYGPARIKADQNFTFGVRVSDGPGIHCHAVASFVPEFRKTYLAAVRHDANGQCTINIQLAVNDGKSKKLITIDNAEQREYNYLSRRCSPGKMAAASVSTGQQLDGFSANDSASTPENAKLATDSAIRLSREEAIFKPESAKAERLNEQATAQKNDVKLYIPNEPRQRSSTANRAPAQSYQAPAAQEPVQYQGEFTDRYAEWKKRKEGGQNSDAQAYEPRANSRMQANVNSSNYSESYSSNNRSAEELEAETLEELVPDDAPQAEPKKRSFWSKMAFWSSTPEEKAAKQAKKDAKAAAKKAKKEAKWRAKQQSENTRAQELEELARAAEEEAAEMEASGN